MQSLILIKRIFIVIIAIVSNGYAMEQEQDIFKYPHTAEKFVREFPFMSYKLAKYRYTKCCNEEVKKEINKKFDEEDNAFNKIMFCAWDVIGKELIKDGQLYQVSLNVPMREMHKVLENWQWAVEVYNDGVSPAQKVPFFIRSLGETDHSRDLIKKGLYKNGDMVRYADQIKQINQYFSDVQEYRDSHYTNPVPIANRGILEAFDLFNKKVKKVHDDGFIPIKNNAILFNYYYTYTLKNFFSVLKNQRDIQVIYIVVAVPIMTAWASKFIENNFCQKLLTHDDIRFNEMAKIFNEKLNKVKAQKANIIGQVDQILLQYTPYVDYYVSLESPRTMIEPYYSWTDFCKINIPFAVLGCLMSLPELLPLLRKGRIFNEDDSTPLAWIVVYGGILKVVAWVLESVSISALGAMAATSTFFLGLACVKTLYDMCAMQKCRMGFEDISVALKRHNAGEIIIS